MWLEEEGVEGLEGLEGLEGWRVGGLDGSVLGTRGCPGKMLVCIMYKWSSNKQAASSLDYNIRARPRASLPLLFLIILPSFNHQSQSALSDTCSSFALVSIIN